MLKPEFMRTILVTGSDTGVGKTRVVAALARLLSAGGASVQIVKVIETGRAENTTGDAVCAQRLAAVNVAAMTLATYAEPLAPASAAKAEGGEVVFDDLLERCRRLPLCDWRILEGAGGIATPVDAAGRDWVDFALAIEADVTVVVVPDRLGAINQARLAHARAVACGLRAGVWLNAASPVTAAVAKSNRVGLTAARVPVWAEMAHDALVPTQPERLREFLLAEEAAAPNGNFLQRVHTALVEREQQGLRRMVRVTVPQADQLNLADNDYLALARDPTVSDAVAAAAKEYGTSASASPLITGWREPHERLVNELCRWHGFPCGLLWNSGYAANSAVLSLLPARGDLVLTDRLIHHSMIAGLLRSGARLRRYEHRCLDQLEQMLSEAAPTGRTVFVVTESVFSMDGGFPDFARLARLKAQYGFQLIVDEAHALGWYGPEGAGLVRAAGVESSVDVLVGTLGKTLASGGAYTLFRESVVRDYTVNLAGEFIYSTALSPIHVAAASAALVRVRALSSEQAVWQQTSQRFRARLRATGWDAAEGDSPVVPVWIGSAEATVAAAAALREQGIWVAAVRPPTVPVGTSRLRFSLKRTFDDAAMERVLTALDNWRDGR